jgi:quinol monooxygenase YgiN
MPRRRSVIESEPIRHPKYIEHPVKENEMIIVTARAHVLADHRDAALNAAHDMRKQTIDEPGCIDYRFWSATDDPNTILAFEQWEESSSLETHLGASHTIAFLTEIGSVVDGDVEVTRFEVSDHGPLFEQ